MDKTSLKKALIEAKEIENFATESAKKMIEKEFLPKIEETVKQTLMEMEEKEINEGSEVVINPGAEVEVEVETDGTIKIETDSNDKVEMVAQPDVVDLSTDVTTDVDDISTETEDGAETEDDEELFEVVESLNEEEGEESVEDTDSVKEKIDSLESKIDKILSLIGNEEEKPEGEVEIIDDEETSTEEVPAEEESTEEAPAEEDSTEEAPAEESPKEEKPAEEEELIFEFDDVLDEEKNSDLKEIKDLVKELEDLEVEISEDFEMDTISDEETLDLNEILEALSEVEIEEDEFSTDVDSNNNDELLEIEIQEGEKEEEMEESISTSLSNRQSQNKKPETPHKEVRYGLNESVKAQYESKIDELKKENESLKTALKEYKDSFVVLRKQINEVQTFNAKLAYANKVFTKGGLTNEEKSIISEQFDSCNSAEEAKALYNKLLKENTFAVKQNVDKIKVPIAASNKSEKGALYESEEVKRMKLLAGIIK